VLHGYVDRILSGRTSWPNWVNRSIDAIADNPTNLLGRLVALRYRPRGVAPAVSAPGIRKNHALFGPVNYSNQATLWAAALERHYDDVDATNFAVEVKGGFDFPAGSIIPMDFYERSHSWQEAQARAISTFTHVLTEAEQPLLGRYFDRSLLQENRFLRQGGQRPAYLAHGTDVRLPSEHSRRTQWSPYNDPAVYTRRLETLAARNRAFLAAAGDPVFVSTPDLLLDVPEASWCPVVVDIDAWRTNSTQAPTTGPLHIVHMPSVALMKGTALIEPILNELTRRGQIDYNPIRNQPAAEMPQVIAGADVVLDQFRLGSYGVAACEAMAAGKVVIGHVLPEVREVVKRLTELELPIIEATPSSLEKVLMDMVEGRYELDKIGDLGQQFVEHVHDGRMSSRVLYEQWINPRSAEDSELD